MALPWYGAPVIFIVGLLVLNLFLILLYKILRDPDSCCAQRDAHDDTEVAVLADNEERADVDSVNQEEKGSKIEFSRKASQVSNKVESQKILRPTVTVVSEQSADSSLSEEEDLPSVAGTVTPISAYGESMVKESEFRFLAENVDGEYLKIYLSLIYSDVRNYVAGKVGYIEGIAYVNNLMVDQIKVHVVFLPLKKYIIRTRYYKLNPDAKKCRIDEYFKMKFRKKPKQEDSSLRIRVYGRKTRLGMSVKEKCLGETNVKFSEFSSAKGGISLKRNIIPKLL